MAWFLSEQSRVSRLEKRSPSQPGLCHRDATAILSGIRAGVKGMRAASRPSSISVLILVLITLTSVKAIAGTIMVSIAALERLRSASGTASFSRASRSCAAAGSVALLNDPMKTRLELRSW